MSLMKALVPSTILTLLVAAIVGALGSEADHVGFLDLENARIAGQSVYWSWPFFMAVMAINGLLVMHAAKRT
ncbi:hypothetical protein [Novosphingobium sp. JCM 18896]|uniref:hypothetical protein n=1 Tax=Novosphingobium sp. JCM 18896 TaxID=2989731 RepID=UPI0022239A17|nr:hypothetical protein [Novosphingobium sp. JCM 18896]MCW1431142.1 hypothetical protein [Novosphingobium sp. JCM 18896]